MMWSGSRGHLYYSNTCNQWASDTIIGFSVFKRNTKFMVCRRAEWISVMGMALTKNSTQCSLAGAGEMAQSSGPQSPHK